MKTLHLAIIVGIGICVITTVILLPPFLNPKTRIGKIHPPNGLVISDDEKQKLVDESLNITGIQAWSNQWQFSTMDFSGISNKTGTDWKYVFVMLHLSPDAKTPYSCDTGWNARIEIDLDTKKIVNAWYPTMQDHECHGITLGPIDVKNVK